MPDYKFDANLIPNVLADQTFQNTGVYVGRSLPHRYAVIDPRRHNVDVWTKANDGQFQALKKSRYRDTAKTKATIFCTNGPPMEPAPFTGSGLLSGDAYIYAGFAASVTNGNPWEPYDVVRSGSAQLHAGRGNVKYVFERTGQGSYGVYNIAPGTPTGVEGIGAYGIVAGGAVVNSNDHTGLKKKKGCAAWCKRPLSTPLDTANWETTTPWFREALKPDSIPEPLDGLIVAVAVSRKPVNLATEIIAVGCSDAIAMDGSDSTLCGMRGGLQIKCAWKKDLVQRWGLYCT